MAEVARFCVARLLYEIDNLGPVWRDAAAGRRVEFIDIFNSNMIIGIPIRPCSQQEIRQGIEPGFMSLAGGRRKSHSATGRNYLQTLAVKTGRIWVCRL